MHPVVRRSARLLFALLCLRGDGAVAGDPPSPVPAAPPAPKVPPAPPPPGKGTPFPVDVLGPVPPGARLTFEIGGGPTHQVGDGLEARFVIHNDGAAPFRAVDDGSGDRRGHERLEAVDEAGRPVIDPSGGGFSGSGPMGPRTVEPGGSLRVKGIPHLGRYLRFDRPGTFRIRASIDLGWTDTAERANPVAEATLVLTRPTPEEAAATVARRIAGKRAEEAATPGRWVWPCLEDLYDPAYVPALVEALAQGELDAVEGLQSIDDPSAIDALCAATQSRDGAIVRAAVRALWATVPVANPAEDETLRRQFPPRTPLSAPVAARVRARLAAFLRETGDAEAAAAAAEVLVRVGSPEEDLDAISRFLDRWLPLLPKRPILRPRGRPFSTQDDLSRNSLLRSVRALLARGASVPAVPRFAGEILTYLAYVDTPGAARPVDLDERCLAWLAHRVPTVRAAALRALSPDALLRVADRFASIEAFDDADLALAALRAYLPVARAAPRVAALAVLRVATDEALLAAAAKLAEAQGARLELAHAWIQRLAEPDLFPTALRGLADLVVGPDLRGGGPGRAPSVEEIAAIQLAWKSFASQHVPEVRDGKRWPLGDPALPPGLFGRAMRFRLEDGTEWPPPR